MQVAAGFYQEIIARFLWEYFSAAETMNPFHPVTEKPARFSPPLARRETVSLQYLSSIGAQAAVQAHCLHCAGLNCAPAALPNKTLP